MKRKAFLIDTTLCTACRSCQVACKQWNKLEAEATVNRGSYENPPDLSPQLYNQIHFIEKEQGDDFSWLFINRRCMHCADAGCMKVCPADGALYHTKEGMVAYDRDKCIGCHYCVNACPFDVPRFDAQQKVSKCHACMDRVQNGLLPACVKACPTKTLQFGNRDELIAQAKAAGKKLYGEHDLGGLGVLYVLAEQPSTYKLPESPAIPASILFWKDVAKPLGVLGFWGVVGAAALHYVTVGPKRVPESSEQTDNGGE